MKKLKLSVETGQVQPASSTTLFSLVAAYLHRLVHRLETPNQPDTPLLFKR